MVTGKLVRHGAMATMLTASRVIFTEVPEYLTTKSIGVVLALYLQYKACAECPSVRTAQS